MGKHVVHAVTKKSWWSGRVTALCGRVTEAGDVERKWFATAATCPDCRRIEKQHKQQTKKDGER